MTRCLALLATSLFACLLGFAQPVIQSFLPTSGAVNTTVTITGTGFSTVAGDNIVYFGAIKALVTGSTATTITATVPAGATYRPITVTTGNLTAYSVLPFVVTGNSDGLPFTSTSFLPAQSFTVGSTPGNFPHGLALGDFNQDGKADLVVSKSSAATVTVLTNTSTADSILFGTSLSLTAAGSFHEGAAAGDLDGDGKLDFVTTNTFNPNSISVYRNTTTSSAISFAAKRDFAMAGSPYDVAIGDVDGDGKPDVVAVNSTTGANMVSVFRNTSVPGAISFDARVDVPAGPGPFSIVIVDLDADGRSEIVVTGQYSASSHLSVLKNNSTVGSIAFQAPVILANLGGPFTVAVGDLNSDGLPDLMATDAFASAVAVKRNTSTPGILAFAATQMFSTGAYPEGVAITDFDGDGKPDVVATNNQNNSVSVLQNTSSAGSISLATHVTYTVGAAPNYVISGDLNGDGRSDLIVANTSVNYVSVLRNIIGANLQPSITSFTPAAGINGTAVTITGTNFIGTTAVKFGGISASSFTVNSSTGITAIVGPGASGEVSVTTPAGTAVLPGFVFNGPIINSFSPATGVAGTTVNITGTNFTNVTEVAFGGVPATAFTVNSATSITAVVGNGATGNVSVTTANGTANRAVFTFAKPAITSFTPANAPVGATVTINGTNFSAIATENAVFFGSVKATVLSATTNQLTVTVPAGAIYAPVAVTINTLTCYSSLPFSVSFATVNPQITTSSFIKAVSYSTAPWPWSVYSCDLNDDGKPELITANSLGNSVSVFKNLSSTGYISFATKLDLPADFSPRQMATGDLDGDGRPDLVGVNYNSGAVSTVSIIRNTSTGGSLSFDPKIDIATGSGSVGVGIADINGDGKPDIVVSSGNSGFFSILQNTTVGSAIAFAPKQDFSGLFYPDELALADIDNDGKTDIVTSNFGSGNVSVFRNTSTGGILSLASRVDFSVGSAPGKVSATDIDMDGRLDLVVKLNGSIAILKNYSLPGTISMGGLTNYALPIRNLNIGDLNGDGKPDICAGQTATGKISLLQNTGTIGGSISFGANVDFTVGNYDTYATIGDLDGDGKPELAAVNSTGNAVTILRNNIDGPTVTQISPDTARKGEVVTITGTDFTNVSVVRFGGVPAGSFTIVSPTQIDAVVNGGASGDVSVTTPNGTGSLPGFKFIPEVLTDGSLSFCINSFVTLSSTADTGNQWLRNGTVVANGNTYQVRTAGTYTVRTTNNGITTTSPVGVTASIITVPSPTITFNGTVLTSTATTGNQWYYEGTLIPNATEQTYQPTQNGRYRAQVTANGCTSALSNAYNYTLAAARMATVENPQLKLKLWPNPVRSNLIIQWNINSTRTIGVEIRDVYGKLVLYKQRVNYGESINVSALAAGSYFVKMVGDDQQLLGAAKVLKVD